MMIWCLRVSVLVIVALWYVYIIVISIIISIVIITIVIAILALSLTACFCCLICTAHSRESSHLKHTIPMSSQTKQGLPPSHMDRPAKRVIDHTITNLRKMARQSALQWSGVRPGG